MIVRAWLVAGTLLIALAWYPMVTLSPDAFQGSATTAIKDYRKASLMPAAGAIVMSKEIGHDVFERPAADAEHLKEERAATPANGPAEDGDEAGGDGIRLLDAKMAAGADERIGADVGRPMRQISNGGEAVA